MDFAYFLSYCGEFFVKRKRKFKVNKKSKKIFYYIFFLLIKDKVFLSIIIGAFFYANFLIVHVVSTFIENFIMYFYVRNAKKIIKDVKVIGITGSFGKTSSKNILSDMLSVLFNVSKTPKSFNNKVGIVKSIRECVSKEDDYFICEYGVDKKGAMDKLLKICKPNISLITEVGPQHILTFKNIENIVNEKIKIAKILNKDEWVVINNDNDYLKNEVTKLTCNIVTFGIKNKSYIMAKNLKMDNEGSSFDLYIGEKRYKNLRICLLGEHNVLNVLGAIGVLKIIGVDFNKIRELVSLIKPIEHRMELKIMQGVKIIDDGFNSNEVGFKKAIDVLGLMEEEKYVITPGIIEQGKNGRIVNYELGKYMADKIDFAILVEENANVIKEGLISSGFDERKIVIKKDFNEAWEYAKRINDNKKIFLIENDLPSIYLK